MAKGQLFNGELLDVNTLMSRITSLENQVASLMTCCNKVNGILKPSTATNTTLNSSPIWGNTWEILFYNDWIIVSSILIESVIIQNEVFKQQIRISRNGVVLGYLYLPTENLTDINSRATFTLNSVKLQGYSASQSGAIVSWSNDIDVKYYNVQIDYSMGIKTIASK